jgi:AraC-like DNA-binding protein
LRMEEAKKILNTTSDSITIVASSLGFYDQSHFTRIFKQFTGFTPKEYQKKQR